MKAVQEQLQVSSIIKQPKETYNIEGRKLNLEISQSDLLFISECINDDKKLNIFTAASDAWGA